MILPGGDVWESGGNPEIDPFLNETVRHKKPVAAICGATLALGRTGHLDHIHHTSNTISYLKKFVPGYQGEKYYRHQPCVQEDNIITANGVAMIEFAITIFRTFQIMDEDMLGKIYELYKSGGVNNQFAD